MIQILDYIHRKVKVVTTDNSVFIGEVISFTCAIESDDDEDEIYISQGTYSEVISESEIKTIEIID